MSQAALLERLVMSQNYDKSNLKLDFENKAANCSRKKTFLGLPSPAILQSPDLKLLKLGSPELEKLIINNDGFIPTPTPGGNSSFMHTGEKEMDKESFARGFIEALQKLQEQDAPVSLNALEESAKSTGNSIKAHSSRLPWSSRDHNQNSVPVIKNRFDNRSPPINRQATTTPVLINFPTVSTGAVSTMGMTSVPVASSYVTRPYASDIDHNRLSHQSSHSMTTSGITLPTPIPVSSTSPILDVQIKSEDEAIVPSSDMNLDMNPIDLDAQEHIKHQRKKLRNRLAAQRCRKRKIEREDTLKVKVKELKSKNAELTTLASTLRMQVCDLKQQVMHHVNEGCQVFLKDSEDEKNLMAKTS
ncbi:transcription factor JunD-like [Hydractinia symbiolongicarpus]|uniref:transcription factor JunD-like n=1 Tax=Hydractinia symbiolongicarpus TaxID=13093 RepID=UPI00254A58AC|nr:transcription factor JunD-like [Hydractinia symbiolongicarpus]